MPPQLPVAAVALAAVLRSPGAARSGPLISRRGAGGAGRPVAELESGPGVGSQPYPDAEPLPPPPLLLPRTLGLPPKLPVAAVALAAVCVRLALR
ncbi:hypothetical protein HXX76_010431 [Chlamydomonas incerta]|uniref:Uncharacterized protein n=1 Tax=Chlamydomonas incerta TaxID=51695 RepID=A0A835SMF5_CHLIN|nr:hypothetical protein HXX76_010431 [Chlamydomonas incerta]|eukprot:KAG2428281.1 hypothetical protein HXX76_010431 [Chlamydomonas incerta]